MSSSKTKGSCSEPTFNKPCVPVTLRKGLTSQHKTHLKDFLNMTVCLVKKISSKYIIIATEKICKKIKHSAKSKEVLVNIFFKADLVFC